jgi:enoyl-CoA hydratase
MGIRNGIRAGTELCALGTHTQSMANFVASIQSNGLTGALDRRDSKFGDYRTTGADGLPTDADQADAEKPSGSINYAS